MAMFAIASFRADRHAAFVKLPLCIRKRASRSAHPELMISPPRPVVAKLKGSGGMGLENLPHSDQRKAKAGMSRTRAIAIPTRARVFADHARAKKINRFTEVSSRKSTLSAKSDTDRMFSATVNSPAKLARFSRATIRTAVRSEMVMIGLGV